MTPRQRVEVALGGGHTDKTPFTMYESMIPQCSAERAMRNRGLCVVQRMMVFKTHYPNVTITRHTGRQDDKPMVRTVYETPVGTLSTLSQPAGFTSWRREKMFKGPADYKALLFLIRDAQFEASYEPFAAAQEAFGDDAIFRAALGLEPLQQLISSDYLAMEAFCIEWMDRRDEILKLYDALVAKRREVYPIVAASPASHANYGGNVVPEVIGLDTFEEYYVQHYNEAAEVMHAAGKLIGCHFDANCKLLSEAIAGADLDYIEAFTPAPDSDMTLAEARAAWPDKVIWLNFPSSVHLRPDAEVEATAYDLADQVPTPDGLIVGITEDMPADRWRDSCAAIMDGLDRHAAEKSDRYA